MLILGYHCNSRCTFSAVKYIDENIPWNPDIWQWKKKRRKSGQTSSILDKQPSVFFARLLGCWGCGECQVPKANGSYKTHIRWRMQNYNSCIFFLIKRRTHFRSLQKTGEHLKSSLVSHQPITIINMPFIFSSPLFILLRWSGINTVLILVLNWTQTSS